VSAIDGYKMARQGHAGAALGIAAIGSFIAGSFATLVIAWFAEPLTTGALRFGPAEDVSLILLGLVASIALAHGAVAITTMHSAKGLEFRSLAVMAWDDEIIPLQKRIESVADDADLEEIYNTERNLFYDACTRARDDLLVTGVEPASEFLDDFRS